MNFWIVIGLDVGREGTDKSLNDVKMSPKKLWVFSESFSWILQDLQDIVYSVWWVKFPKPTKLTLVFILLWEILGYIAPCLPGTTAANDTNACHSKSILGVHMVT